MTAVFRSLNCPSGSCGDHPFQYGDRVQAQKFSKPKKLRGFNFLQTDLFFPAVSVTGDSSFKVWNNEALVLVLQ